MVAASGSDSLGIEASDICESNFRNDYMSHGHERINN